MSAIRKGRMRLDSAGIVDHRIKNILYRACSRRLDAPGSISAIRWTESPGKALRNPPGSLGCPRPCCERGQTRSGALRALRHQRSVGQL
jgi:hypothetical protein